MKLETVLYINKIVTENANPSAIRKAMACVAGGVVIPGVLSWQQKHRAKQAVMPQGKIPPATFLRGFEFHPLLSP